MIGNLSKKTYYNGKKIIHKTYYSGKKIFVFKIRSSKSVYIYIQIIYMQLYEEDRLLSHKWDTVNIVHFCIIGTNLSKKDMNC